MRNIIIHINHQKIIEITLREDRKVIAKAHLTAGQDFDTLLIRTLDKIFRKNKIERLSLKSVEISGKMTPGRLSDMILETVAEALSL